MLWQNKIDDDTTQLLQQMVKVGERQDKALSLLMQQGQCSPAASRSTATICNNRARKMSRTLELNLGGLGEVSITTAILWVITMLSAERDYANSSNSSNHQARKVHVHAAGRRRTIRGIP